MEIRIPWMFILIFIALSLFYYFNQKSKIKREQRKNTLEQKKEDLLMSLRRNEGKENQ